MNSQIELGDEWIQVISSSRDGKTFWGKICDKSFQLWFGIICQQDEFQDQADKFIKN